MKKAHIKTVCTFSCPSIKSSSCTQSSISQAHRRKFLFIYTEFLSSQYLLYCTSSRWLCPGCCWGSPSPFSSSWTRTLRRAWSTARTISFSKVFSSFWPTCNNQDKKLLQSIITLVAEACGRPEGKSLTNKDHLVLSGQGSFWRIVNNPGNKLLMIKTYLTRAKELHVYCSTARTTCFS